MEEEKEKEVKPVVPETGKGGKRKSLCVCKFLDLLLIEALGSFDDHGARDGGDVRVGCGEAGLEEGVCEREGEGSGGEGEGEVFDHAGGGEGDGEKVVGN